MDIDKVRALSDGSSMSSFARPSRISGRLGFRLNTRQLKDTARFHRPDGTIARILTVQRERRDERSRAGVTSDRMA